MKYLQIINCILVLFITGCDKNNELEKKQKHRDNIIDVSKRIKDIKTDISFGRSLLYIIDDVLIVEEVSPKGERGIHLFEKNSFKYITSTGTIGRGPGEITLQGRLCIDKKNRVFWAPDNGKKILYKFPLDSVLMNKEFLPGIKKNLNDDLFINGAKFLNDSIALGRAVHVVSVSSIEGTTAKLNINTNVTERFGYSHPITVGKKAYASLALSVEENIYVNCYSDYDLISICDLNGNLKQNVYGPGWYDHEQDKNDYFNTAVIFDKYIIASYLGSRGIVTKGNITKGALPSKLIVFDLNGNYIKTIEMGFEILSFCIDEENRRIIAYFNNRGESLGYFDIP